MNEGHFKCLNCSYEWVFKWRTGEITAQDCPVCLNSCESCLSGTIYPRLGCQKHQYVKWLNYKGG